VRLNIVRASSGGVCQRTARTNDNGQVCCQDGAEEWEVNDMAMFVGRNSAYSTRLVLRDRAALLEHLLVC